MTFIKFFKALIKALFDKLDEQLPAFITKTIKDYAIKSGMSLGGVKGMIFNFFLKKLIKYGIMKEKDVESKIIDFVNGKEHDKLINDPTSTNEQKKESELDLLNRR